MTYLVVGIVCFIVGFVVALAIPLLIGYAIDEPAKWRD